MAKLVQPVNPPSLAKPAGYSLTSVEFQAKKYVEGLPASLMTAVQKSLPFAYISQSSGNKWLHPAIIRTT